MPQANSAKAIQVLELTKGKKEAKHEKMHNLNQIKNRQRRTIYPQAKDKLCLCSQ